MNIKRLNALVKARTIEFFRDRASLAWNIILPMALIVGMSVVFSDDNATQFKVGTTKSETESTQASRTQAFYQAPYIHFIDYADLQTGVDRVQRHQLDLMLQPTTSGFNYWVNRDAPNSYIVEQMLIAAEPDAVLAATQVTGDGISYTDWLLPGVLGMNIMFSCLFGVGYVIVRYRKNGYLKRLYATPTRAVEFLLAQILSRLAIVLSINIMIFVALKWTLSIPVYGSYLLLLLIAVLGALCLIAMGVTLAARTSSEEFAGGLLNMISWPMLILSGVWFSLEGAPAYIQAAAQLFPLTHLIDAARAVMFDGAGLLDIRYELLILTLLSGGFLAVGSWFFKWRD